MKASLLNIFLQALVVLFMTFQYQPGYACDRSSIALDSLVFEDGFYSIYITQNVGAGITGSGRGGDNSTFTFAYSFFGDPLMTISAFTPSITSDFTQVTNTGTNVGPFLGSTFTIGYISPGPAFTCVNSTAGCGHVHSDAKQVVFTLSEIPDSIRLYGIEGSGNPLAGCSLDSDMLLTFGTLPVVWEDFSGVSRDNAVELNWRTAQEVNTNYFSIQRSTPDLGFVEIGRLDATGNSSEPISYEFVDERPEEGMAFYRIVQVDQDGQSSSTEVIRVQTELETTLSWTHVGPIPAQDHINLGYTVPQDQDLRIQLYDLNGQAQVTHLEKAFRGSNSHLLDLNGLAAGTYILRVTTREGALNKRIVKL